MPVAVTPVRSGAERRAFVEFPYALHARDPHWVPPLRGEVRKQLDPKRNPFFRHADTELFLARAEGKVVGRISAHVDRRHNEVHRSRDGMFGFFESVDDLDVARALLGAASGWVKARGMDNLRGPYSWSMHEYVGNLVSGFDTPPMVLMGHNPPYYDRLIGGAGLSKIKDLFAFRFIVGRLPEDVRELVAAAEADDAVRVRPIDMKRFPEELRVVFDIYNEAWKDNWGFVPISEDEIEAIAADLKMLVDPGLALIAEVEGRPAGMIIAIPNVNEALRDLKGRLTPWGLAKLLWRVRGRRIRTGRCFLLGIRREFRGPMSLSILMKLYGRIHTRGEALGYKWGELSWTLEDNDKVNRTIRLCGAEPYKTYRLYGTKV